MKRRRLALPYGDMAETATPVRVIAQTRLGRAARRVGGVLPGGRADLVLLAPDGPDRGAVEAVVAGGIRVRGLG